MLVELSDRVNESGVGSVEQLLITVVKWIVLFYIYVCLES